MAIKSIINMQRNYKIYSMESKSMRLLLKELMVLKGLPIPLIKLLNLQIIQILRIGSMYLKSLQEIYRLSNKDLVLLVEQCPLQQLDFINTRMQILEDPIILLKIKKLAILLRGIQELLVIMPAILVIKLNLLLVL